MPLFVKPDASGCAHAHRLLFFDLLFVAAILHLGNLLATDFVDNPGAHMGGGQSTIASLLYFVGLWLTWNEFSSYMVRYFAKDTMTACHFFVVGAFVLGMAAFTGDAFDGADRNHFAYAFTCCRVYFCIMHLIIAACNSELRRCTMGYCAVFLSTGVLLSLGATVHADVAVWFWVLGYIIEFFGTGYLHNTKAPKFCIELMAERHGELVMIAVGEAIIQLIVGPVRFDVNHIAACIGGYGVSFSIVLLYFECQPEDEKEHAYHRGGIPAFLFTYMHAFLLYFLMCVGVGVKLFLKIAGGYEYTKPKYAWFFCVCLLLAILCSNIIRLSHKAFRPKSEKSHEENPSKYKALVKRFFWVLRFLLAGCILLIAGFAYNLAPMASLLFTMGLTATMVLIDVIQRNLYPEAIPLEQGYHAVAAHDDNGKPVAHHHSAINHHPSPSHGEEESGHLLA